MRDIETQLRIYFDASVERVTAEDVLAGARVDDLAGLRPTRRRWRTSPAAATAIAFVTTLLVGGVVAVMSGVVLDQTTSDVNPGSPLGTTTSGATLGWTLAVGFAIGVIAGFAVWAAVRRVRKTPTSTKEERMTTMIETPDTDRQLEREKKRTRTLLIVVIVLGVIVFGMGAWIVYDATTADATAPADVVAAVDAYAATWNDYDSEAFLATVTQDYLLGDLTGPMGAINRDSQAVFITSNESSGFHVEALGEPIVSGSAPRWWVARSEEVTFTNQPTEHLISVFLVRETNDGLRVSRHEFLAP